MNYFACLIEFFYFHFSFSCMIAQTDLFLDGNFVHSCKVFVIMLFCFYIFTSKGQTLGDGQLNIKLDDLLKADKKGRWWIVGSAWEGRSMTDSDIKGEILYMYICISYIIYCIEISRHRALV